MPGLKTTRWDEAEITRLLHLRYVEKRTLPVIAGKLSRSLNATQSKLAMLVRAERAAIVQGVAPPRGYGAVQIPSLTAKKASEAQALRERDERLARPHRSITAFMLGDPLPGRSALDLRGRA